MESAVFDAHYKEYCRQIAALDFQTLTTPLGIELGQAQLTIPFLDDTYFVSKTGICDTKGDRPGYGLCVILSKYLLRCPAQPVENNEWAALKDFHNNSQFTNVNVFKSDAERPVIDHFSGRTDALEKACKSLGGTVGDLDASYDIAYEFDVLPRIRILLLFNDQDGPFPASCSLLFQRQAESYLDPESLIMSGIAFSRRLIQADANE